MGFLAGQSVHARDRDGPGRRDDFGAAPPRPRRRAGLAGALALGLATAAPAETIRLALFNTELSRDGPGLLLRDLLRGDDQATAVAAIVAHVNPDILVLLGVDWDAGGAAASALGETLAAAGADYPHRFLRQPNSGLATDLDLDGDGRRGGPRDAQGFGRFPGEDGIVLFSRWPIDDAGVRDFTGLLWRDLPGAVLPEIEGAPFPSPEAQAVQRLSSVGHWAVPVATPGGVLELLVFHATAPVFDGPEDRNGLRNRDEIRLWSLYLDGALGPRPTGPVVLMGDANLDPEDGAGLRPAIRALLADPRLQDPAPRSAGGAVAEGAEDQRGDPALDTVDWPEEDGPGNLRVEYVLPDASLTVIGAGVFWPDPRSPDRALLEHDGVAASRHRLVWVDLRF